MATHNTASNKPLNKNLKNVVLRTKLLIGGLFLFGVLSAVSFNKVSQWTNTEQFCISCHEMKDNVYQEYLESPHDVNPSGVRATCPDCHVPKELGPLVARKLAASMELFHWIVGTYDTKEKFDAHRLTMAKSVWDYMKHSDSRECRSCHTATAMDLDYQDKSAQKKHKMAQEKNMTCIDCHKGIAHELPEMEDEEDANDDE